MTTANPFPGLRPFEPDETHLFFGRDGQSEEIIRRLGRTRFLAVVGTSGSGKSSLVRAGLLPALQGGLMASAGSDWRIAVFRPGHDPVGNLARALAAPEVFGSGEGREAEIQAALTEATLRRSSLGLLEVVRQARGGASGTDGRQRFMPYENLLVVVDQFEELFRFRQLIEIENSKEDAAAFVRLLLEAGRRPEEKIYVVLTMRSDFLGDCAQFQGLPEAINDGQYLIPRMTRDERREAVTGPVAVGGGRITDPLVNQLLNDMGDNPDQLPILQHALMRTWDYWLEHRRDGEPIDLPHYLAVGGMGEALSRHAEEAYGELGEAGQEQSARQRVAEKLFKALTEKGADNREIRRPVELGEACEITEADESDVAAVVEVFRRPGRSFLMPPAGVPLDADSLIDISHESLIRNWARLKKWTDEEAQSARIYKRLADTAVLHKAGEEALYKDPALQVALDWREKNRPNAAWARRYHPEFETAMSFLDASVAAREAELKEREKQRRRDVSLKRTKLATLLLALSFLLAAAASVYAYKQSVRAEAQRVAADKSRAEAVDALARANEARAQAEAARADATKRKVVAEEQAAKAQEEMAEALKQKELAEAAMDEALRQKKEAEELKAAAEQQAKIAQTQQARAEVALREVDALRHKAEDAATASQQLLYGADINLVQQAYEANNFERADELLYTHPPAAGDAPRFEWRFLWHLTHNDKSVLNLTGSTDFMTLTPDGRSLVVNDDTRHVVNDETKIELLDPATGQILPSHFRGRIDGSPLKALQLSPDGKTLLARNIHGEKSKLALLDAGTGRVRQIISVTDINALAFAFAPDGKTFALAAGGDESVRLLDVESLRELGVIKPGCVTDVIAFSPDSRTLATGGKAPLPVVLWDVGKLKEPTLEAEKVPHCEEGVPLPCAITPITDDLKEMVFSPDGRTLMLGFADKAVWKWDGVHHSWGDKIQGTSRITSLGYSPDGKLIAVGYNNGSIRVHDSYDLTLGVKLGGHQEAVHSLAFSRDGKTLYTGSRDSVRVWDVESAVRSQLPLGSGEVTEDPGEGPSRYVSSLVFSPDGRTLASMHADNTVAFWDAATRRRSGGMPQDINAVAFSPDGQTLAYATGSNVVLWDRGERREVGRLERAYAQVLTFSPDGKLLVTGGGLGFITLWDVSSRAKPTKLREVSGPIFEVVGPMLTPLVRVMFSPDGRSVAACYIDGTVKLWDSDFRGEQTLNEFSGAGNMPPATTLAFSPDGHFLAVGLAGGYDPTDTRVRFSGGFIRLWEVKTEGGARRLEELPPLRGHRGQIISLAFSRDGRTLYSSDSDGTAKLWDMVSFREMISTRDENTYTAAAAFSPDGRMLATGDTAGNVYLRDAAEKDAMYYGPRGGGPPAPPPARPTKP